MSNSHLVEQTLPDKKLQVWLCVLSLALGAFVFNTTEFVPVGLLGGIGQSFSMPPEDIGLMITIYAWMVALMSLPLMLLTAKIERKKLLIGIFILFIVSHVLSFIAQSFVVLVIARLGIAFSHAIFWSITASLVIRIAPHGKKGKALSMLASGSTLAMVLGVPLGRLIGGWLGWRATFFVIAATAALVMVCLVRWLPRLPSQNSGSLASLPLLLKRPALICLFVLTLIVATSNFTVYSYIEIFVQSVARMNDAFITLFLLLFGGAGIIGSVLFGWLGQRYTRELFFVALATMALSLSFLHLASITATCLMTLAVIWGAMLLLFHLSIQSFILSMSPDSTDVSMAVFSAIFNVGIGAGSLVGNLIISGLDAVYIGYAGAFICCTGLLCAWLSFRKFGAIFSKVSLES